MRRKEKFSTWANFQHLSKWPIIRSFVENSILVWPTTFQYAISTLYTFTHMCIHLYFLSLSMYVCRMCALIALVCWVLRLLCYGWLASFSNRYKDSRCQRIGTLTKLPSTCTQKHCGRRTFTLSDLFYVYHCYKEMVVNCSWSYIKRGCWRYLHPVPSTIR